MGLLVIAAIFGIGYLVSQKPAHAATPPPAARPAGYTPGAPVVDNTARDIGLGLDVAGKGIPLLFDSIDRFRNQFGGSEKPPQEITAEEQAAIDRQFGG